MAYLNRLTDFCGDLPLAIPARYFRSAIFGALVLTSLPGWAEPRLQLADVIDAAIEYDPWLRQSAQIQQALLEESIAEGALPDPRLSLGAANLPVDTFDTGQEAMTQATVGIIQRIPRGDSLQLSRDRKEELAGEQPFQRENRRARVVETATRLWLDVWEAQQSIGLIEDNRDLFEQLSDVAEAGYITATMISRQQDVVRGTLELTRLDDRLTDLRLKLQSSQEALGEWIGSKNAALEVAETVPPELLTALRDGWSETSADALIRHPLIRSTDQQIKARAIDVDIAREAYKPEWTVSAQYGYRDRAPGGQDRADLFSVGIGFDLPLFTGNLQDRQLNASAARLEAEKTERILQLRVIQARARSALARIKRLDDRIGIYRQFLLPQMEEQAEAALTAYNNDDGDFAEAVRARIDDLNAKIELIGMTAERARNFASFRYLTSGSSEVPSLSQTRYQD